MSAPTIPNPISETGVSFSVETFFNRVALLIETWKEVLNFQNFQIPPL